MLFFFVVIQYKENYSKTTRTSRKKTKPMQTYNSWLSSMSPSWISEVKNFDVFATKLEKTIRNSTDESPLLLSARIALCATSVAQLAFVTDNGNYSDNAFNKMKEMYTTLGGDDMGEKVGSAYTNLIQAITKNHYIQEDNADTTVDAVKVRLTAQQTEVESTLSDLKACVEFLNTEEKEKGATAFHSKTFLAAYVDMMGSVANEFAVWTTAYKTGMNTFRNDPEKYQQWKDNISKSMKEW